MGTDTDTAGPQTSTAPQHRLRFRTLLAAIGVVFGIITVVALAIVTHQTATPATFAASEIDSIAVDVGAGYVHVFATDRDDVQVVTIERAANLARPEHDAVITDGVLGVDGDCAAGGLGICEVSFQIEVPRTIPIDVDLSAARGIITRDLTGRLRAATIGGDLVAQEHRGDDVEATSVDGTIRLVLRTPASVRATTTTGNVLVRVPDGTYDVTARTASGHREIGVDTSATADRSIVVDSRDGNVAVLPG